MMRMCAGVAVAASSNMAGRKPRQPGRWKTAVRLHTSSRSLSTTSLLSSPPRRPSDPHLSKAHAPSRRNDAFVRTASCTHSHIYTHTRPNTARSDPDHWAESTFQLFITTLQNTRRRPAEGWSESSPRQQQL